VRLARVLRAVRPFYDAGFERKYRAAELGRKHRRGPRHDIFSHAIANRRHAYSAIEDGSRQRDHAGVDFLEHFCICARPLVRRALHVFSSDRRAESRAYFDECLLKRQLAAENLRAQLLPFAAIGGRIEPE
jgi:hypothetical protein